jgi:hypothetical protein
MLVQGRVKILCKVNKSFEAKMKKKMSIICKGFLFQSEVRSQKPFVVLDDVFDDAIAENVTCHMRTFDTLWLKEISLL